MKPKVIILAVPLEMMHLIDPKNLKGESYDLVGLASTESEEGVLHMKEAIDEMLKPSEEESLRDHLSKSGVGGLLVALGLIGNHNRFDQSHKPEDNMPSFDDVVVVESSVNNYTPGPKVIKREGSKYRAKLKRI